MRYPNALWRDGIAFAVKLHAQLAHTCVDCGKDVRPHNAYYRTINGQDAYHLKCGHERYGCNE